jgi:hypothetical protein
VVGTFALTLLSIAAKTAEPVTPRTSIKGILNTKLTLSDCKK